MSDAGDTAPSVPVGGGMVDTEKKGLSTQTNNISQSTNGTQPSSRPLQTSQTQLSRRDSLDFNDYFKGPRDSTKHSKWPLFLQLHGSILPKMIMPLTFVAAWSTAITCITMLGVHDLGIQSTLLTVTGFVVGLGLSFRSSTAYERYSEGRRLWGQLILASQNLGRMIWIHTLDDPKDDVRTSTVKKVSTMNLLVAFCVSLKHALRFEPYTEYSDLKHLVVHLNTFAREATVANPAAAGPPKKRNVFKSVGEYLGVSFAASNPRKAFKRSDEPLGNLPLEILNHLAVTLDFLIRNAQLNISIHQTIAFNSVTTLNDVLTGCDRVLNTPLPIAYGIAISQITWVYIVVLPFQLVTTLEWIAIPGSIFATYIILGLLLIGREIENPFGHDVNDLALDRFCDQIAHDLDLISAFDKRTTSDVFMLNDENKPLYPVSHASAKVWLNRDEDALHEALRAKPKTNFNRIRGKTEATSGAGDHNA